MVYSIGHEGVKGDQSFYCRSSIYSLITAVSAQTPSGFTYGELRLKLTTSTLSNSWVVVVVSFYFLAQEGIHKLKECHKRLPSDSGRRSPWMNAH